MGGWRMFPLAVLLPINFFDEFDSASFNVLAPDIRREFGLKVAEINAIVAVNVVLTIFFVIGVGYAADRWQRKGLIVYSAFAATAASFSTGLSTGLGML